MDEIKRDEYYKLFLQLFFNTSLTMPEILKELNLSRNNNYFKYCLRRCRAEFGIDGRERGIKIKNDEWNSYQQKYLRKYLGDCLKEHKKNLWG